MIRAYYSNPARRWTLLWTLWKAGTARAERGVARCAQRDAVDCYLVRASWMVVQQTEKVAGCSGPRGLLPELLQRQEAQPDPRSTQCYWGDAWVLQAAAHVGGSARGGGGGALAWNITSFSCSVPPVRHGRCPHGSGIQTQQVRWKRVVVQKKESLVRKG